VLSPLISWERKGSWTFTAACQERKISRGERIDFRSGSRERPLRSGGGFAVTFRFPKPKE
jgi:hypothetical protein